MNVPFRLSYSLILLTVLAEQIGLPFPSPVFLMTGGALSANGKMRMSIVVLLGVLGCIAADGIWFALGRRWGSQVLRLLCRFAANPRTCAQNANDKFRRYGPPVLSVAKFLPGLNFVLPPLVGAEGVSIPSFLAFDLLGALLWSAFYTGLGYLFSNQLDAAIGWVKHFGTIFAIVILVCFSAYAGSRGVVLLRMMRRLRLRRIGPAMLARKLKAKAKIAVLDLLDFEGQPDGQGAIPGAFRVDPSRLRNSPHLTVPADVDIVLYSSSGGDAIPARAAVGLQRIGVNNVWVLEGGLKAWRQQGFPLAQSPDTPEDAAARVGVTLPEA